MCTIIGLRDKTTKNPIIGSNSDNPWNARTRLIVNENHYKFIGTELICEDASLPWANMVTRGLNEKGLAYTFAYVQPNDQDYTQVSDGINFRDFSLQLLGKCANVKEAVEMIGDLKRAFHGNFILSDNSGDLKLAEVGIQKLAFLDTTTCFIRCNHYCSTEMNQLTDMAYAKETNSHSRYEAAVNTFESLNSSNKDSIIKVLTSHNSRLKEESLWGHSPCNHGLGFGTVSSEIIDPLNGIFYFNFGWPCGEQQCNSEQLYQDKSWGKYEEYVLDDLHSGIIFEA